MKQYWIQKNGSEKLILYFAGWGTDHAAVEALERNGDDICAVYDYRDLSHFDASELKTYDSIQVVAWSMGVWVAAFLLQDSDLNISRATAINGTPNPINDRLGIPEAVFTGTLEGLTPETLPKFDRRMCGSKAIYQQFVHISRPSDIAALKQELQNIFETVQTHPLPCLNWTKALVGRSDMIFPAANQKNFWSDLGLEVDMPHYPYFTYKKWSDFL